MGSEVIAKTRLSELLLQLDGIEVDSGFYRKLKDSILSNLLPRTLVDVDHNKFKKMRIKKGAAKVLSCYHIRITGSGSTVYGTGVIRTISSLVDKLRSLHGLTSLRSIYISSELTPTFDNPVGFSEAMQELEEECRKESIEIVYELQRKADFGGSCPCPSDEFWRRQREKMEAEGRG